MIRRKLGQRSLADVAMAFGAGLPAPEALMDPVLLKLDGLLEDDVLVDAVFARQARRHKHSGRRGRRGTPAEVVLRMLVLKQVREWTFERLEWEVRGNICYRRFCRIDAGKVPDATTLVRQAALLDEATLRDVLARTVAMAQDNHLTAGRKLRVDTTVVEADIHHPTDSGLCADVVRVLSRAVRGLVAAGVKLKGRFADVSRSVGWRLREIAAAAKRRGDKARRAMKRPYRRLLAVTRRVMREADSAAKQARNAVSRMRGARRRRTRRAIDAIATMLPRGQQVVRQTRARVLRGVTNTHGKMLSVFEPWARILRRGKPHKPVEFGLLVKVQEAEGGIVTDVGVAEQNADAPLLLPSVERHIALFGRAPRLVATDRGFYSAHGEHQLAALGVKHAAIPKPGGKSAARASHERQRWFKHGRAWRAGGEARISRLKRHFGMRRSRLRGEGGLRRTALWAAIANNWVALARHD